MPQADAPELAPPLTGISFAVTTVAHMIGDSLLVDRSFRDHPTQLIEAPDRASFIVEVKATRPEPKEARAPRSWTVEVSAPGADGLGPVVLREDHRSVSRATRRARAIRRHIRRGAFSRS